MVALVTALRVRYIMNVECAASGFHWINQENSCTRADLFSATASRPMTNHAFSEEYRYV